MEEVQKNENGTTAPQADGKPKKENKPKRELTPQQVQQRRKMIVFPLMFLAFAGCMYLIFAPSGKEDVNVESVGGFNADIPLPAEDGIIADKQKAYEQAVTSRKQQDKIQSLQDFGFTLDDDTEEPQEEINLLPEEDPKPQRGGGASSRAAYRDINRQLSTFYETPPVDEEKEELKRQVAELTDRLKQQQNATPTADDQMALLEKSYELAARYNGKEQDASSTANAPNSRKERTAVRPVKRVQNRMVSSLAQPAGNEDIASGYAGERNTGFHTPVGKMPSSGRNTIAACVHGTQTVSDGQALRIRLLEPMAVDDLLIPKGTVLVGGTRVEGERMGILIETVEYRGTLFPVELEVYDADGQQGILVPNSMEYDAAREIAAGMGTSIGSSINISTDAGAQIASDVGKGVIRGVSQYVGKKMRTVKITLKAGHRLLLHSPEK